MLSDFLSVFISSNNRFQSFNKFYFDKTDYNFEKNLEELLN